MRQVISNDVNTDDINNFFLQEKHFSDEDKLLTLSHGKKSVKDVIIGMLTEGVYVVTETHGNMASGFFKMTLTEAVVPLEYGEDRTFTGKPEMQSKPNPKRKMKSSSHLEEKNRIHWLDGAARLLLPIFYCSFLLFYLLYYSSLRR